MPQDSIYKNAYFHPHNCNFFEIKYNRTNYDPIVVDINIDHDFGVCKFGAENIFL